jgi:DNA-binding response OmpR family regulator
MRILIIDDDPRILDALTVGFTFHWPESTVVPASSGEAGLRAFNEHHADIVVLDVMMPGKGGFEVLQEIRKVSDVPVIFLTARGEDHEQVRGLELGADDYVVKPFNYLTLLARITAVLRCTGALPSVGGHPDFSAGGLEISFSSESVTLHGEPVKLTPVEYRILLHLVRNAGRVVTHQALLDEAMGSDHIVSTGALKVFISWLRSKIEPDGEVDFIQNERGLGYRFVKPRPSDGNDEAQMSVSIVTPPKSGSGSS